ncbi:MAG TPA: S8 family serine peptidase [Actinomycetes bacterium]|nr:S8 family serine peptidase [Actinomycetes bacterium]
MSARRPIASAAALTCLLGLVTLAGTSPATAASTAIPAALRSYVRADRTGAQWSLASTHAAAAWTKSTGSGVVVATVDTGADESAPDLQGQLVPGAHLDKTGRIVAGDVTDTYGHGTHVAGIIAAKDDGSGITGIAPGAKVMPINVDSPLLDGETVGEAIHWATDHGAKVINLSLGFDDIKLYQSDVAPICAASKYAYDHGVVVVAAAGNDGEDLDLPSAPADCGDPISVAALDNTLQTTSWSSFDPTVALAAPGANIYSTVPTSVSRTRYATFSGTSMASPFVAGVAALVLAEHPGWTPDQVKTRLEDTAEDLGPSGFDPRYGYGAVDPAAAVGAAAPAPVAVHFLTAGATGLPSRLDADGDPVIDHTLVTWEPDATAKVTGYTVTTYAPSGTTTTDLPGTAVRYITPVTTAGYVVTAHTTSGDLVSPPVWYSVQDDTSSGMTTLKPVQHLKARFTARGSVVVSWTNPKVNAGHADVVFVVLNNNLAVFRQGKIPTHVTVPARSVPPGDLAILVDVVSSQDFTDAAATTKLGARVPFSGTAARAGFDRYRLTLNLAPSWGHRVCHLKTCEGVKLFVVTHGVVYVSYLDEDGQAVTTVRGRAHLSSVLVRVRAARHHYHRLDMTTVHLKIHRSRSSGSGGSESGGSGSIGVG